MNRKRRVLGVDDDPINNDILTEILNPVFDVKTVSTGKECLDVVHTFRPELILLDIMMPDLNGYEVCKRLKDDPATNNIPVIMVSARALLEERLNGYQTGANDYITKPFEPTELLARVKIHIALKSEKEIGKLKSDLLHLVTHETRTPLNGILGFAGFLHESKNLDVDDRDAVEYIVTSGKTLLSFIEKAILLLHLQQNYEPSCKDTNLTRLLADLVEEVQASASAKDLEIHVLSEPDNLTVPIDTNIATRAFRAILENAVKFSPESGKVEVRVEHKGEHAVVSVNDQGPGVPPETQEAIFAPFAIEDIAHHSQGQGLSLAITKRVAELLGGDITVCSEPGRGATFVFSLPANVGRIA